MNNKDMENELENIHCTLIAINKNLSRIADSLEEFEHVEDYLENLSNCVGVYPVCTANGNWEHSYRFDVQNYD